MYAFSPLLIPFEGVPNARELGGYIMSDGSKIKKGILLRTGSLSRATDSDLRLLHLKYGVIHTFDYRTPMEQRRSPDKYIEGSDYVSLPCIDPDDDIFRGTEFSKMAGRASFFEFVADYAFTEEAQNLSKLMYPSLVMSEFTQLQYGTFLNYASRDEYGALLWHCSQGKDRTGLASAFLLFVLGASRELIIKDFDYSNSCYSNLMNEIKQKVIIKGGTDKELDVIDSLVGVNTNRFIGILDLIDTKFGSMNDYIHNQLCLTDTEIIKIRKKFLE